MADTIPTSLAPDADFQASQGSHTPIHSVEATALAIVQELIPGPVWIEDGFDPETPSERWRVIHARSRMEVKQLLNLETIMQRRIIETLGEAANHIVICLAQEVS